MQIPLAFTSFLEVGTIVVTIIGWLLLSTSRVPFRYTPYAVTDTLAMKLSH